MLPDISNRINNLIKAMEKTIVPAIDAQDDLAKEQAVLLIGHLKMLDQQWDKAGLFERGSLDTMVQLSEQLIDSISGGEQTSQALATLQSRLQALPAELPLISTAINALTRDIGNAVEATIVAFYRDGAVADKAEFSRLVLDYGSCQSSRERIWFGATNLDPEVKELASLDEMLATPRAARTF